MTDAAKNRTSPFDGGIGRAPSPKRFYKDVGVSSHEAGFALMLDGGIGKTPVGNPIVLPSEKLARLLAAEWAGQGERLDLAAMPITRIVNSALDGVVDQTAEVCGDIVRHAGSDLLCYRADGPEGLVKQQEALWSPLVAFAREDLGARLILAEGIIHVEQDSQALAAIENALNDYDAVSLAAIHTATTLTSSAVIALAVARGLITSEAAWTAAHVDEDWQMSQWGLDESALERRALRWREMAAAGVVLKLM